MAKFVVHIADIHIHERNYIHIRHSWANLLKDIKAMPNYKLEVVLVIAGDIFDHKTYLTAGDVSLFYEMMSNLEHSEIQTIMIPGNHDYNINNSKSDKIHALVERAKYKHVIYQSSSGVLDIAGLLFFVHSPIDLQVPRPEAKHIGSKTIALVHEPLSESKTCSGMTFGQQRFSASDFTNIFDMTMMGDIHMPQLLAHNVAYSGSFVQKNKGEGLKHGYMLWNVDESTPTFIEMYQLSLHLKLWANENKMDELPDVTARSISLYHADCDNAVVEGFRKDIESKYGQRVTSVFDKTTLTPTDVKIPTKQELSETVSHKLTDMKLDNEQAGRIIKMHRDMFSETAQEISSDWCIRFLSWSNVYCYGEDNFMNFDEIGNLTSMIGPNKVGKSSVIDILMLVLFNQTTRGSKRNALNVNSSTGHIKCVITVADDEYAIERAWIDKKTVAVRVYKNGENITNEDLISTYALIGKIIGSKRVFINSTAALQHRQFLVDLGSKEIYELVCRMMELDRLRDVEDQNNAELRAAKKQIKIMQGKMGKVGTAKQELEDTRIALKKSHASSEIIKINIARAHERRAIVSVDVDEKCQPAIVLSNKLHGLKQFERWDDEIKLAACLDDEKDLMVSIDILQRQLANLSSKRDALTSELKETHGDIPILIIAAKLKEAEGIDITPIVKVMGDLKSDIASANAQIVAAKKQLDDTDALIASQRKRIDASVGSIKSVENDIEKYGQIIDTKELLALITMENGKMQEINVKRAEAQMMQQSIRGNRITLSVMQINEMRGIDFNAEEDTLRASRNDINSKINAKRIELQQLKIQLQSKQIATAKHRVSPVTLQRMKWNDTCDCCKENAAVLHAPTDTISTVIKDDMERVQLLTDELKGYDDAIERIAARIVFINSARIFVAKENYTTFSSQCTQKQEIIKKLTAQLNDANESNTKINQLKRDIVIAKENDTATSEIARLLYAKKQLDINIDTLTALVKTYKDRYANVEKPMLIVQEARKLREEYVNHIHNEKINAQINALNVDIGSVTIKLSSHQPVLDKLRLEINKMSTNKKGNAIYIETLAMFEAAQSSEDAIDELQELDTELADLMRQNTDVSKDIASSTLAVGRLEQIVKVAAEEEKELSDIMQNQADRAVYDKIINHKTGVPEAMMKTMCSNIQSQCNEILKDIADFQIGVVFEKEISINTVTENSTIPAEQSSGYQKFIIDLIMRQVLCSLTLAAHPRILFVDEGFGSLDKENFEIVCKTVLPSLASHFEKVVIISHIPGIHKHTTTSCIIKQANGRSQLQFGQIAHNGLTLRVQIDHAQYQKNMNEKKEEAKAINATDRERKKQEKRTSKAETERVQIQRAEEKQADYGESIIDAIDNKTVVCRACDKTYKNRSGFAASHIKTKAHMKCMRTFDG